MSIISIGRVTAINDDSVVVQCSRVEACGMCNQKNSCAVSTVSKVFSKEEYITLSKPKNITLELNQFVSVKAKEKTLIKTVLVLFLFPLLCAVLISLLGSYFDGEQEEWRSILGLAVGAIIGFFIASIWSKRFIGNPQYILEPVSSSISCKN